MPRSATVIAAIVGGSVAMLSTGLALADPQTSVAMTGGVAGVGQGGRVWDDTVFHLGLHGDVLFGRERNADFGVGPYFEVGTFAFDQVQVGAGLSTLLPVIDYLPLVVSLGGLGRVGDEGHGLEPGLAAAIFWGSRSYNFHSPYGMSGGLTAQLRRSFGASEETAVVIGAQVDLAVLSLPFVLLYNAARGGGPETDPVP